MNAAATNPDSSVQKLVVAAFINQDTLNKRLHPEWWAEGWPYYRAIWTEIAEATGHLNWYWWKTGQYLKEPTPEQMRELHIELVDILHFGLSMDLVATKGDAFKLLDRAAVYEWAFDDAARVSGNLVEELEAIVVDAILVREFNVKKFARACHRAGLDLAHLMAFYFAKTVLNKFRWNNGYNEKTYIKMWPRVEGGTVEDNTVMGEILAFMIRNVEGADLISLVQSENFEQDLYTRLERVYSSFAPAKSGSA